LVAPSVANVGSAIPVIFWAPMGRAAVIAERPPRSTEFVISVPISVSSVLKATELMLAPDTAAVLAGWMYVPFA
jgi:hypothetical protein